MLTEAQQAVAAADVADARAVVPAKRCGRPSKAVAPVQPASAPVIIGEGPEAFLAAVVQMAANPLLDASKLEKLLAMQEHLEAKQAEREFNAAFLRLQARLPRIKKDGTLEYPINKAEPDGPKRKIASFAKWETIDAVIRPILGEEGFVLSFETSQRTGDGGGLVVTAILAHSGGHTRKTSIPVPLDTSGGKNNLQGYGSALSYGQRYSAKAILNLQFEGEDDDGVKGGEKHITDAQAMEIEALILKTKTDRAGFMGFYGLDNLLEMTEAMRIDALGKLHAKQDHQQAAQERARG